MNQRALRFLPVLVLAFGCAPASADTASVQPEPADTAQPAQAEPQGPPAPASDILEANQRDIEALRQLNADVSAEIQPQIVLIDDTQKAIDQLTTLAQTAKLKEDRLDTIVGNAAQKGQTKGAQKFAKADREAAKAHLETLHRNAPQVSGAPSSFDTVLVRIESDRAKGQELLTTIEGRSNAVSTTPLDQLHPDLAAQVQEAREAFAQLDAKATASGEVLAEASTRAKALAEALGVDVTGPSRDEADVSEAPQVAAQTGSAATPGQGNAAAQPKAGAQTQGTAQPQGNKKKPAPQAPATQGAAQPAPGAAQ